MRKARLYKGQNLSIITKMISFFNGIFNGLMRRVLANGPRDQGSTQVESYQRLKKWYLMLPCLTLSIIRYGSKVKWSNPGNGVVPSPTAQCSSYWKGSLRIALNYGRQQCQSHPCRRTAAILFNLYIFTNPSARAGYDTRSVFKWSSTGLNSEFSFS